MKLAERMAQVQQEAKHVRESMTLLDPTKQVSGAPEPGRRLVRLGDRKKAMEAAIFFADCMTGRRPSWHLKEAMSTSDFPNLMGDVLYRMMLGNYSAYPVTYPRWTRIVSARDFRSLHLYTLDGGQGRLDKVGELAPYPETKFVEGAYTLAVAKYGRRYGISFEMVMNDDMNAFNARPRMMALGARRTQEYLATSLICDATGPHPTFFTNGHANIVTGNPILSVQGLQKAMQVLASQTDADGEPIIITAYELIVPPALEITAQNILNALQIRVNSSGGNPTGALPGGGTIDQFLYAANWMRGRVTLSVNPYLSVINTTSGNTAWYIIANPNDDLTRPAFAFANLRGHETPELYIKDPDQRMLGGGDSDPMEGSFDNDSIDYKVRAFMGAAQIDPKMAVSSTGVEA